MACFLAPAAVAVTTTIAKKVVQSKEMAEAGKHSTGLRAQWLQRLRLLNLMMWGGTILLVIEHAVRGELVPWAPFFTALQTPGHVGSMLREIATEGTALVVLLVCAWMVIVMLAERRARARRLAETPTQVD
jgi:hypothetical protein